MSKKPKGGKGAGGKTVGGAKVGAEAHTRSGLPEATVAGLPLGDDASTPTGEPLVVKPTGVVMPPRPGDPDFSVRAMRGRSRPEEDDDDEEDDEDEEDDDEDDLDEELAKLPTYSWRDATEAFALVFRFLKPFVIPYRKRFALLVLGIFVETIFNSAFPLSLKFLIDNAFEDDNVSMLAIILAVLAGSGVIASLMVLMWERQNAILSSDIHADIRTRLFDHIQYLPANYYARTKTGEVLSRFGADLEAVDETVTYAAQWGILPALELLTGLVILAFLSWQLTLLALLMIPITLLGPRFFAPRAVATAYDQKRAEASVLANVQENIQAQLVVKAFSLRPTVRGWFLGTNRHAREYGVRMRWYNTLVERSVTISMLVLHLFVFGLGAWLTFNDYITLGSFVTFESIFWEMSSNIMDLTGFIPAVIQGSGAVRHINDLLNEPARAQDPPETPALPRPRGRVTFDDVTFSYDGTAPQLEKFSIDIPAGARAAIVGASGSGKSTALNLLMRLYDAGSGRILIDGTDIGSISRDSLRRPMGIVFQDNFLFNISLKENIRLGNPDASDAAVMEAARAAEIHRFIRALPNGYDTIVGERGAMLSGGQRQRVAIARAILRDPAILVLDEATSALDGGTEAAIMRTIGKIAAGRTVISVTHRLRTTQDFDVIYVLSRGRLVEYGGHAELMARKGAYQRLWSNQSDD